MTRNLMILSSLTFAIACGGEGEDAGGTMQQVDPPSLVIPTGTPVDTGTPPSCGGADLCARSIDECGIVMDQAECESWYDVAEDIGDCADIEAYTQCNCDCIGEDTCDGYFACGQLCFVDFC
jgi:hypothetical protein